MQYSSFAAAAIHRKCRKTPAAVVKITGPLLHLRIRWFTANAANYRRRMSAQLDLFFINFTSVQFICITAHLWLRWFTAKYQRRMSAQLDLFFINFTTVQFICSTVNLRPRRFTAKHRWKAAEKSGATRIWNMWALTLTLTLKWCLDFSEMQLEKCILLLLTSFVNS